MQNQNAALLHHLHYVFRNYAFAYPTDEIVPLGLSDRHLLASLLQKAIRRGESEIARAAARALLRIDPRRLFRRLGVIAFEDIGLGDCDLGLALLAASANARWREGLGGKDFVVDRLVLIAARAIKERSADHLWSVIRHDPDQENEVRGLAHASMAALLGVVGSSHLPLSYRARAALLAAGRHPKLGSTSPGTGDVGALFAAYTPVSRAWCRSIARRPRSTAGAIGYRGSVSTLAGQSCTAPTNKRALS